MNPQSQSGNLPWYGWLLLILLSPILLALTIVFLTAHLTTRISLYLLVWIFWLSQGRNVLYVYSNSSIWKEHIESTILPQFEDNVVVLNWSERKQWRTSLATLLFRHFGGVNEFNPMAIVFRPFRAREEFRFWRPFQSWKKGRKEELEKMERGFLELVNHLGQTKAEQNVTST